MSRIPLSTILPIILRLIHTIRGWTALMTLFRRSFLDLDMSHNRHLIIHHRSNNIGRIQLRQHGSILSAITMNRGSTTSINWCSQKVRRPPTGMRATWLSTRKLSVVFSNCRKLTTT